MSEQAAGRVRRSTVRGLFQLQQTVEVEENTFAEAGNVGVWTKADSVTLFDDFTWAKDEVNLGNVRA
jgi:hypothetical protein